jgi:hypothetical protein
VGVKLKGLTMLLKDIKTEGKMLMMTVKQMFYFYTVSIMMTMKKKVGEDKLTLWLSAG